MSSEDVRRLQTLLASDTDVYPEGTISGYFGSLTQKAVGRFQVKYGVATPSDLGYGNVGPKTRAKFEEVFGAATPTSTGSSVPAVTDNALFTENLKFGMRSSNVYRLQQLFATDNEIYPEGVVSGYFGQMTKEAVQRFQIKHGVVTSDEDAGYGSVGPKTRAKLQEIFK
ncbi:MAG: peptidoglycan-binding protein [Patescibacteria group bacterium]